MLCPWALVSEEIARVDSDTDQGRLDLNLLKELGRSSLVNALNSVRIHCTPSR